MTGRRKTTMSDQSNNPIKYLSPLTSRGRNGKVFLATFDKMKNTTTVVCKISRSLDYSVRHENAVMERLEATGIPNFPKTYGLVSLVLDANFREKINPLYNPSDKTLLPPVSLDGLLIEYIEDSIDMDKFLQKNKDSVTTLALVKQVLLAVAEAHERVRFTHYDLHPANVLVQKTEKGSFEYTVGGKTYRVPSCGYRAVIIDFGLSYVDGVSGNYCPLFHTNIGVTSYRARQHTDYKLFLVSLAHDLVILKLDKFVKKIYGKVKMDWETGWDHLEGRNTLDSFYYRCYDKRTARSRVLSEYGYIAMAILQSLCDFTVVATTSPPPATASLSYPSGMFAVEPMGFRSLAVVDNNVRTEGVLIPNGGVKFSDAITAYNAIDTELSKIESKLGCVFYCIYVFRRMVDAARLQRERPVEETSVKEFRHESLSAIDSVAKYCTLETVDWNALLSALYTISAYMSRRLPSHSEKQQVEYKIAAKTHADIYAKFCTDFPKQIS